MPDIIVELLKQANVVELIAIGLMFWFFYSRLNNKIDKTNEELNDIREDIKELRTSLNRMEGAFYSKDCCMLKDDKQNKKAE